jgi:hypothetical protein
MKDEYAGRRKAEKKRLMIETRCMKDIDFFWVADVVNALLQKADRSYLLELDANYILDLSYIQNELLLLYERSVSLEHREIGTVPTVRIVNAFVKFLNHACQIYQIHIHINNYSEMDSLSMTVLKHIKVCAIDNLCINK